MLISQTQLSAPDLVKLDDLIQAVHAEDGGTPAIYQHLLLLHRTPPCHFLFFLGSTNTPLIGFLSLYFFYPDCCEVSLMVHPNHRHRGIAGQLIQASRSALCPQIKSFLFSSCLLKDEAWQTKHHMMLYHTEYHLSYAPTPGGHQLNPANFKLSLHAAQFEEIPTLSLLDKRCFENNNHPSMFNRFHTLLSDAAYDIVVARLQQTIIGKVHLRYDQDETLLTDLAIDPDHQHQGYGSELLSRAMALALTRQFTRVVLDVETTKPSLLKLYLRHGFLIDRQTYYYLQPLDLSFDEK